MSALRRQPAGAPVALEARVSNPDPDGLTVMIDDFDGDLLARHAWEVVSWPRLAGAVPARGDRCLVVMSEIGRVWVVAGEWSGSPHWRTLRFSDGWSATDAATAPVGYAISPGGWVALRGVVSKTDRAPELNQRIFADPLPPGCRPLTVRVFPSVVKANFAARVRVSSDGFVTLGGIPPGTAAGDSWTLDGIGYWAEA